MREPRLTRFRRVPVGNVSDGRADTWVKALKVLGWDLSPGTDEELDAFGAAVEPHMLAIDEALRDLRAGRFSG